VEVWIGFKYFFSIFFFFLRDEGQQGRKVGRMVLTTAFTGIAWTRELSKTFLKSAASLLLIFEKLLSSGLSYSENFLSI